MNRIKQAWKQAKTINTYKSGMMSVDKMITVFIGAIILFQVLALLYPLGTSAGDTLNNSGFPLGSFFTSGGIIWLVLAAGVVLLLIKQFRTHSGK